MGAGRATCTALAAGPDGLYFADLYKDFGDVSPVDAGANVFRIRYVGVADFSAYAPSGPAPVDRLVPGPLGRSRALRRGTGILATVPRATSTTPFTFIPFAGTYDVRLTVTGPSGSAARQKAAVVAVPSADRQSVCCRSGPPPSPRVVRPL